MVVPNLLEGGGPNFPGGPEECDDGYGTGFGGPYPPPLTPFRGIVGIGLPTGLMATGCA